MKKKISDRDYRYKRDMAVRPVEWIRDYVMLDAKALLKSGKYTVQQVSDMLNFPNQSFFGTYFKKESGISPKAYMSGK